MKNIVAALAACLLAASAAAHEGEDHSAPAPAAAAAQPQVPRAAAASELFELVAVANGEGLMLYLDRFETGEPVSGARIEIEGSGASGSAAEIEPGVYRAAAMRFDGSRAHALTFSVEAGDDADLLALTLPAQSGGQAAAGRGTGSRVATTETQATAPVAWVASGALLPLLLAGGALVARKRRRPDRDGEGSAQ